MTTVETLSDMSAAFQDRLNTGRLDDLLDLLTDDAVSRTPEGEVLTDRAAIREDLAGMIAAKAHLVNTPRLLLEAGGSGLMIIDWTLGIDTPEGRAELTGATTNVVVRREGAGWKIAVLNPQGTAA